PHAKKPTSAVRIAADERRPLSELIRSCRRSGERQLPGAAGSYAHAICRWHNQGIDKRAGPGTVHANGIRIARVTRAQGDKKMIALNLPRRLAVLALAALAWAAIPAAYAHHAG